MAKPYTTPGVYVEEISTLPASVAQVPSAIPAFIGYTELVPGAKCEPVAIGSLAEYREKFGDGPPVNFGDIVLDNRNELDGPPDVQSKFYLYDSMRMFYQNGGGDCYVVSLGDYSSAVKLTDFTDALTALRKEQDPTLIVLADAVALDDLELYTAQQSALRHCNDLGNRFCIFDLHDKAEGVTEFRNNIGLNNSKFGAAYSPWLSTVLSRTVTYRNIKDNLKRGGSDLKLDKLNTDDSAAAALSAMDDAVASRDKLEQVLRKDGLKLDQEKSLADEYQEAKDTFLGAAAADRESAYKAMLDKAYGLATAIDAAEKSPNPPSTELKGEPLTTVYKDVVENQIAKQLKILLAISAGAIAKTLDATDQSAAITSTLLQAKLTPAHELTGAEFPAEGTEKEKNMKASEPFITSAFEKMLQWADFILQEAARNEKEKDEGLQLAFPLYRNLISRLEKGVVVPPSGAIAGVYASVDDNRGVWKAPANVSLSGVVGLTETIDDDDQGKLNVDVNAGLSINAIRAFTGKGILVWGARTLSGNDNEWRYVPVRRLFITVEESIRRSTGWVVFEPNDANTWIKVKAMIENYLTGLWRDGALAGPTPEQAFFVNVGLGTSMTPQDVLEGRMYIEVGMAAVRPAEFVILRFSHKLQTA